MSEYDIEQLLEDAVLEGVIQCGKCDCSLEPDAEKCRCGWKNPLVELGMI